MHYLDDFLTIGPPKSDECQKNLGIIKDVCHMLGIPLALEKVEGPSTALEFLRISLDTCLMEARLPDEKLEQTKRAVREWLHKKSATKREILSLVGLLQHATKVVRPGRSFLSRMYGTAVRVPELHYFTQEFRSDLTWWHLFLEGWNGMSFLQVAGFPQASSLSIQTDASGNWGCGGHLGGSWFKWQWPPEWLPVAIMAKELVPIVLSCAVWGRRMVRRVVLFQCDNASVVSAVKKGSSKDPLIMRLLRCLWFFVAYFDTCLTIEHLAGALNITADQLSRNNMQSLFVTTPQADQQQTPLPAELLQIMALHGPDWTSQEFKELFAANIRRV